MHSHQVHGFQHMGTRAHGHPLHSKRRLQEIATMHAGMCVHSHRLSTPLRGGRQAGSAVVCMVLSTI